MSGILLYVVISLIIISIIIYGVNILVNRKIMVGEESGFDICKEMTDNYDEINIVEGTSSISFYNIKRHVIKISKRDYYGSSVASLGLVMLQAGVSLNDNGSNKLINSMRKILPTLKIIDLFFLIVLFINYVSMGVIDGYIGLVILLVMLIIHYLYIDIINKSADYINGYLTGKKEIIEKNKNRIINFINKIILSHKLIFIGEVVAVIRMVAIILNM